MFSTHIPRTWPTITKFRLLINTNSEIKIRNIATFLYQAFKKRNCVPILCIIPLCKYLPCFSCFVHALHAFHMYCLWRWTCLFMPNKIFWLLTLKYWRASNDLDCFPLNSTHNQINIDYCSIYLIISEKDSPDWSLLEPWYEEDL